jgi:hypothetical protein
MTINVLQHDRIGRQCICCDGERLTKSPAVLMPFVAKRVFDWDAVEITEEWGMRTLRTGMAYPLCNSIQCIDCGTLFLDIRFSDAEMERLYSGYRDAAYSQMRDDFEPGYSERNDLFFERAPYIPSVEAFLQPYLPHGPLNILDWGGDTGVNTPFRHQADSVGVYDISGLTMIEGVQSVNPDRSSRQKFNLIVCSNVLEHVPSPRGLLNEIAAQMSSETVLYLEVPYEALMMANQNVENIAGQKKYWHEHINFFSKAGLQTLISKSNLDIVALDIVNCDVYGRAGHQFFIACRLSGIAHSCSKVE